MARSDFHYDGRPRPCLVEAPSNSTGSGWCQQVVFKGVNGQEGQEVGCGPADEISVASEHTRCYHRSFEPHCHLTRFAFTPARTGVSPRRSISKHKVPLTKAVFFFSPTIGCSTHLHVMAASVTIVGNTIGAQVV